MSNYYAQIDASSGTVSSVTQLAEAIEAAGLVPIESLDTALIGQRWNPETQAFEPAPPQEIPPQRHVSPLAFRRRFTLQERAAIEWAAVDRPDQPDAQRMQAAALRATLKDQEQATYIDLDDSDVEAGVQTLESMGLLQPGRAEQILGAAVQPGELP